jgi:hypothetical protein
VHSSAAADRHAETGRIGLAAAIIQASRQVEEMQAFQPRRQRTCIDAVDARTLGPGQVGWRTGDPPLGLKAVSFYGCLRAAVGASARGSD